MQKIWIKSTFSLVLLISGCTQGITQNVTIDNSKQTELISKLVDRIAPSAQPVASASAESSLANASASPAGKASNWSETEPAGRVWQDAEFEIFATRIPKPADVTGLTPNQIELARKQWLMRYAANSGKAYEVLKMFFDVNLLSSANSDLGKVLMDVILAKQYRQAESTFNPMWLGGLMYKTEKAIVAYYSNAGFNEETKEVYYTDFDQRKLLVADSRRELDLEKPVIVEDPTIYEVKNPVEGTQVTFLVVKKTDSFTGLAAKLILVFENGAWKIHAKDSVFIS